MPFEVERQRKQLLVMFLASGATTAAVTILVLSGVVPVEWFFGAPVLGALVSSAVDATTGDRRLPLRQRASAHPGEQLTVMLRRLEVEREIQRELEEEQSRTFRLLSEGVGEESLPDPLWTERQVRHLEDVELQRWESAQTIRRLSREQADAHARLIVAAEERGVGKAKDRAPGDLVALVIAAERRSPDPVEVSGHARK
jgi:hypothetical protein